MEAHIVDEQRIDAMNQAKKFVIYQESEQADQNVKEKQFDAMWQSIYDVCKLVKFQIIDDISQEEFDEAYRWLLKNQPLTEDYQNFELEF